MLHPLEWIYQKHQLRCLRCMYGTGKKKGPCPRGKKLIRNYRRQAEREKLMKQALDAVEAKGGAAGTIAKIARMVGRGIL